jgi:selenide,water dikinase
MANTATVKLTQQLKAGGCTSKLAGVHAMTDVTGFGLMGQGRELAPIGVTIEIVVDEVPHIEGLRCHPSLGAIPPGLLSNRDFAKCGQGR